MSAHVPEIGIPELQQTADGQAAVRFPHRAAQVKASVRKCEFPPEDGGRKLWRVVGIGAGAILTRSRSNSPALVEATGLEVDKYDAAAVRRYLESYLKLYRDTVGDEHGGKKGIRALLTDSIEGGASNWTPQLPDHFKRLRGYDLKSWLLFPIIARSP